MDDFVVVETIARPEDQTQKILIPKKRLVVTMPPDKNAIKEEVTKQIAEEKKKNSWAYFLSGGVGAAIMFGITRLLKSH